MAHGHETDAEYVYPSDVRVVDVHDRDGELRLTVVVPRTECEEPVELDASVTAVEDAELDLPLEDAEDVYD